MKQLFQGYPNNHQALYFLVLSVCSHFMHLQYINCRVILTSSSGNSFSEITIRMQHKALETPWKSILKYFFLIFYWVSITLQMALISEGNISEDKRIGIGWIPRFAKKTEGYPLFLVVLDTGYSLTEFRGARVCCFHQWPMRE